MPAARVSTYAASTIVEALTASDDRAKIPAGDFASFVGGWAADDWIYCAIRSATAREIVKVNVGESNVFQGLKIERGQDGDTAQAWPAGSLIYQVLNAATLNQYLQEGQHREVAYNPNGVLAPLYFGEKIYQTDLALWWMSASDTGTEWRLIAGKMIVETPVITPEAGAYPNFQAVTMECVAPPGATIWYTLDGTDPVVEGAGVGENTTAQYTESFILPHNSTTLVKAIAVHQDRWWTDSDIVQAEYITFCQPAPAPIIYPASGNYDPYFIVEIIAPQPLATIHYTLDGTTPTAESPIYEGPLLLLNGSMITVKAYCEESPDGGGLWTASEVTTAVYTLTITCVDAGLEHTVGIKTDKTCIATGSSYSNASMVNSAGWVGIVQLAVGDTHSVGLTQWGACVAVGDNFSGECNVEDWYDVVAIAATYHNTVALKDDGTCYATGSWYWANSAQVIAAVTQWTDIVQIATADCYVVGLKSDGTCVWAGSDYRNGDVGDITSWTGVKKISTAYQRVYGLKEDGTLLTAPNDSRFSTWNNLVCVECGPWHEIGLKTDGTCISLGSAYGAAYDVAAWTDIVGLACGGSSSKKFTVGRKSDGSLVGVGDNSFGQLNFGTWDLG